MRVVIISGVPPWPLKSGGALRTHAILSAVARQHEVTFSSPACPASRKEIEVAVGHLVKGFVWIDVEAARAKRIPQAGSGLRRFAEYVADFLLHLTPLSFRRVTPAWEELLRPVLVGADAVICRHADTWPLAASVNPACVVVDADDILFLREWQAIWTGEHGWGSVLVFCESLRTFVSEQLMALRCARTLVASERDGTRLLARSTTVVRNGAAFDNTPASTAVIPGRIVFVGNCDWEPNYHGLEWFLRLCWPGVLARVPGATLAIVGGSATTAKLPFANAPGVVLADNVPSVRPWIESATAAVVPLLRGAGTRIKIIEAIGYGTPVVSTPVGAAGLTDGLGEEHGLTLAASPAELINAIASVLADPGARQRAAAGREVVRARYTWDVTTMPVATQLATWIER